MFWSFVSRKCKFKTQEFELDIVVRFPKDLHGTFEAHN